MNSKLFFPKMDIAEASLLAINICPKLINEVEHKSKQPAPSKQPGTNILTERDLGSIEYLGGYVIRKLYYQYKGKDGANELVCSIFKACRSEEISNQPLISSLSRGNSINHALTLAYFPSSELVLFQTENNTFINSTVLRVFQQFNLF